MSDIQAHLFPFSVDKEGSINCKQYFKVEKEENGAFETVLLGRKLKGCLVNVPESIEGRVYEKNEKEYNEEEEEESSWTKTNKTINEFILWKKDKLPSKQDARINALEHWIQLSEAVNEPIPL